MARYFYGCDEINRGWEQYFELCNAIDLDLDRFDEPPKTETLNRWRVESPKNFCFILRLPVEIRAYFSAADAPIPESRSEYPQSVIAAWKKLERQRSALAARALLLQTGSDFTPGELNRQRLSAFVDAFTDAIDAPLLWEPSGLWTIEQTRDFADELGIVPVFDPFMAHQEEIPFTHGDVGLVVTERTGMRRQFDVFDFKQLLRWTSKYDRVFVMLRGRHKWAHAQHMKTALQSETS